MLVIWIFEMWKMFAVKQDQDKRARICETYE